MKFLDIFSYDFCTIGRSDHQKGGNNRAKTERKKPQKKKSKNRVSTLKTEIGQELPSHQNWHALVIYIETILKESSLNE